MGQKERNETLSYTKRIATAALAALVGVAAVGCQSTDSDQPTTTVAVTDPATEETEGAATTAPETEPAEQETEPETLPVETEPATQPAETDPETQAPAPDPIVYEYVNERYAMDGDKVEAGASDRGGAYGGAFYNEEILNGNFEISLRVTPATAKAEAGLLFGATIPEGQETFEGYAFTLLKDQIFLYRVRINENGEQTLTEVARNTVGNARAHIKEGCALRVARQGDIYRFYYCDDLEGVEPWPEFELYLGELEGVGVGYFDNGRGASFEGLTVTEAETAAVEGATYLNPIFDSADPCVLYYDGTYYCYATSEFVGYHVYTSTDLVNWTDAGACAGMMWGLDRWYWAPEVIEKDGKFYMIATVDEHIGIAVADSPLGPFVPEENWLYEKSIDGHIFIDDDGRAYLYYVSWQTEYAIYGCELDEDLRSVKEGTTVQLLKAMDPWETVDGGCVEGPYMLKHNGTYYLTYSGTVYTSDQYAVGYATSDSPLGTFRRYDGNPILNFNEAVHGPGHHSFTTDANGDLWIVYHRHNSVDEIHPRMTCIDRARFAPTASGADRLEIYGPTSVPQLIPH